MKALLFHCKEYETKIDRISNRPNDIKPEEIQEKEQKCEDCIVVLVTIEKDDKIEGASSALAEEISKMSKDVTHKNIVILPFAHLSNNLAKSKNAIGAINLIEEKLKKQFHLIRAHFGSHKSLLLNIYGHPGNARYREF